MNNTVKLLQNNHPFRQWKEWIIPGTQLTLVGYSRANDKTFFYIPELKLGLDAGLCEGRKPDTLCITHTHDDHIADIAFMSSKPSVKIYLPSEAEKFTDDYIRARKALNHVAPVQPDLLGYTLHGVTEGDVFRFGKGRVYEVSVIRCEHKVPSVGYCFSEVKRGLKPEFEEIKSRLLAAGEGKKFGKLMAEKRKAGVILEEESLVPGFAFLGDTHVSAFGENPGVFDYPVIITECTFIQDSELERARQIGHTVWSDLKPIVENHPENLFVLTHFSLRYSDSEIISFFKAQSEQAPGTLDNIVLWASEKNYLPQQHQHHFET